MAEFEPIDAADLLLAKVQSLCLKLRQEGFVTSADTFEDRFIKLYDDMLPFLAQRDFENPKLKGILTSMVEESNKMPEIVKLFELRTRIIEQFGGMIRES